MASIHRFQRRYMAYCPTHPGGLDEMSDMPLCGAGGALSAIAPELLSRLEEGGMEMRDVPDFDEHGFLGNFSLCSAWMQQFDLLGDLKRGKGIVKYSEFLPAMVADQVLASLEKIPAGKWVITEAGRDYSHNNIDHKFLSMKHGEEIEKVVRCISLLLPEQPHTFSAAKYVDGHRIEPHDDKAFTTVKMEDGSLVLCSRSIAIIYYLTRDWKASDGGILVDHVTGREYVPEFNSAIAFVVPRMHEVTPVKHHTKARYSLFGWFLEEGKSYKLDTDAEAKAKGDKATAAQAKRKEGGPAAGEKRARGAEEAEAEEGQKGKGKGKGKGGAEKESEVKKRKGTPAKTRK